MLLSKQIVSSSFSTISAGATCPSATLLDMLAVTEDMDVKGRNDTSRMGMGIAKAKPKFPMDFERFYHPQPQMAENPEDTTL
jgi:hypothetical protein